jgi:membrane protein
LPLEALCAALRVDPLRIEPVLEALVELDWTGHLAEAAQHGIAARIVLLIDPSQTPLEPLLQRLLLTPDTATEKLWTTGRLSSVSLREVL